MRSCLERKHLSWLNISYLLLQVLNQDETPLLYSLVFGEGVVNDATSVVLFNAIQRFDLSHINSSILLQFVGNFLHLFFTSTVLGVVVSPLSLSLSCVTHVCYMFLTFFFPLCRQDCLVHTSSKSFILGGLLTFLILLNSPYVIIVVVTTKWDVCVFCLISFHLSIKSELNLTIRWNKYKKLSII